MSHYSEIDPIIDHRAKSIGAKVVREWADAPARFFYTPGDPPFECFQVSVDSPKNGRVAVFARAVDTNDDSEDTLERTWEGPIAELADMMAAAIATVANWKVRTRERCDPLSP